LHKKSFQSIDYLSSNSDSNCIFENTTYSKDENNKEAHVCFSEKGLHTMHLNIQHFMPKFDEITLLLNEDNSADIFSFCETFLTDKIETKSISIAGYNIIRKDRIRSAGGGIIVYVKDTISFIRRHDLENEDIESIWLQINCIHSKPYLINFIYRPPSSPQSWIDAFEKQLNCVELEDIEWCLVGDFNLNCFEKQLFKNKKWEKLTIDFSLHQYVSSPTRETEHSSSIIDHLYSKFEHISEVFVPKIALSDHYPVAFTLRSKRTQLKSNEHKTISYRCFKHFDHDNFKIDVAHANLDIIETIYDPNEALTTLYSKLNKVLDKHAPL